MGDTRGKTAAGDYHVRQSMGYRSDPRSGILLSIAAGISDGRARKQRYGGAISTFSHGFKSCPTKRGSTVYPVFVP